jgi:hypothetical protein
MGNIPTQIASGNINTGSTGIRVDPAAAGGGRGNATQIAAASGQRNIDGITSLALHKARIAQAEAEEARRKQEATTLREKNRKEGLWVLEQTTQARRDSTDWFNENGGHEHVDALFDPWFQTYKEELVKGAPSPEAGAKLMENLLRMEPEMYGKALGTGAQNRVKAFVADYAKNLKTATDQITLSDNPEEELRVNQNYFEAFISDGLAEGWIDEEVANDLRASNDELAIVAIEAMIAKDPDRAEELVNSEKHIPPSRRQSIRNKIEQERSRYDSVYNYSQRQAFSNALNEAYQTGTPPKTFDIEAYAESFQPEYQAIRLQEAKDAFKIAEMVFANKSLMRGASAFDIDRVLANSRPESGPNYSLQAKAYDELRIFGEKQKALLQRDPAEYVLQVPRVQEAFAAIDPEDPATRDNYITESLAAQEAANVPQSEQRIITRQVAAKMTETINEGGYQEVVQTLQHLQTYGKRFPEAWRDLVNLSAEHRVETWAQLAALHVNAPWIGEFVDVVRNPDKVTNLNNDDSRDMTELIEQNKDLRLLRFGIKALDPSQQPFYDEVQDSVKRWAAHQRGLGRSVRQSVDFAVKTLIGQAFGFLEINNHPIPIRRNFTYEDEQGNRTDVQLTDEHISKLRVGLRRELKGLSVGILDLQPFMGDRPPGMEKAEYERQAAHAIRTNGFWAPSHDNTHLILYMYSDLDGNTNPVMLGDGITPYKVPVYDVLMKSDFETTSNPQVYKNPGARRKEHQDFIRKSASGHNLMYKY